MLFGNSSWFAALATLAFVTPAHANSPEGEGEGTETVPAAVPAGMWWADYDADGLRDAYTISLTGGGRLLRNTGDGTFQDVTVQAGLQAVASPSLAVWHDYDRDGDSDLYLGTGLLMQNAGDGTFQSVSERVGIAHAGIDLGAEWVDYDQDGLVDLFVRTDLGDHVYHAVQGGSFETVVLAANPAASEIGPLGSSEASEEPAAGNASAGNQPSGRNARTPSVRTVLATGETVPVSTAPAPEAASNGNVGPFGFALPICADMIVDQTSLACIEADSTPTLGRLYPLSTDLNLDAVTGNVRINNTGSTLFRLDVSGLSGALGAAASKGAGGNPPTNGYAGVVGATPFDGVASASWAGLEMGLAGISAGGSTTDNYGVMGHSNGTGVRGEHAGSPATDFGELGLAGVGVRASGTTAAGEFEGSVNVRDGEGDLAARILSSATGTSNDLELYRDGLLAFEHLNSTSGLFSRFINTATGGQTLTGGTSNTDGSAFLQARDDSGLVTAEIDGDSDDISNGISAGALIARSQGVGGGGGELDLQNNDGATRIQAFGGGSADGGVMDFFNSVGGLMWRLDGEAGSGGSLTGSNDAGLTTVFVDTDSGGGALMQLEAADSNATILLDADSGGGAAVTFRADDGSSTLFFDGEGTNSGGNISVRNDVSQETVALVGDRSATGTGSQSGLISMWDRNGTSQNSVVIEAEDDFATGSQIRLEGSTAGTATIELDGSDANVGQIEVKEADGSLAFRMFNTSFTLHNAAGATTQTYNRITGAKSAVVGTHSYGRRLLYAMESPGNWFEDFGSGQLVNGQVRIDVDPMFLETITVDEEHPMKVFITLTGDCNGVFVQKGRDHFVVRELAGGASNASFDWRLVAKRRGLENVRLKSWAEEEAESMIGADPQVAPTPNSPIDGDDSYSQPETGAPAHRAPVREASREGAQEEPQQEIPARIQPRRVEVNENRQ